MKIRLAAAQVNPAAGDVGGNAKRIAAAASEAGNAGCDLVVFPPCAISGWPLGEQHCTRDFFSFVRSAVEGLARSVPDTALLVGYPELHREKLFNSFALLHEGDVAYNFRMTGRDFRRDVPIVDAGVFSSGRGANAFTLGRVLVSVSSGVQEMTEEKGVLVIPAAYPYAVDIPSPDLSYQTPVLFSNLAGSENGIVFRGGSSIRASGGAVLSSCGFFDEGVCIADVDANTGRKGVFAVPLSDRPRPVLETGETASVPEGGELYDALVVGVRDFVRKNGFESVLIGASGGMDSSLVLAICADALGAGNVTAVTMPSAVTSEETRRDAQAVAENLGCRFETVVIAKAVDLFGSVIPGLKEHRVAQENIQARIRGLILMSLANVRSSMVIATGNRSEAATGYCTLYGDTVGGYAAIGDVPKTEVYRLAAWRNRKKTVIPRSVVDRVPTAELSPGQTDQECLPPYPELDGILEELLDNGSTPGEIARAGFASETIDAVMNMVASSEYKRRQSPPATRIHWSSIL